MMVRFNPANDNFCIFHAYVKPSFKNTGKYSIIVALAKSSDHVAGAKCYCKAAVVVVAGMLPHYYTIYWIIQSLG